MKLTETEVYREDMRRKMQKTALSPLEIVARDMLGTAYQAHYKALEAHCFRGRRTALKWLLKFVSLPLDTLTEVTWRTHRYHIASFSQMGILQRSTDFEWAPTDDRGGTTAQAWNHQLKVTAMGQRPSGKIEWLEPSEEIELRRLPIPETVKVLQARLMQQLEQLRTSGRMSYSQPRGEVVLVFNEKRTQFKEKFVPDMTRDDTPENVFFYRCVLLLSSEASRLRRCRNAGCGKWFVAGRRDKRSCDDRCRARSHNRRERGTPPERFGKLGRPVIQGHTD